jgi:hypothetical protein
MKMGCGWDGNEDGIKLAEGAIRWKEWLDLLT